MGLYNVRLYKKQASISIFAPVKPPDNRERIFPLQNVDRSPKLKLGHTLFNSPIEISTTCQFLLGAGAIDGYNAPPSLNGSPKENFAEQAPADTFPSNSMTHCDLTAGSLFERYAK